MQARVKADAVRYHRHGVERPATATRSRTGVSCRIVRDGPVAPNWVDEGNGGSMTWDNVPRAITDAVRTRNLVPLIGAGFSRQASPAYPGWETLLRNMTKYGCKRDWIAPDEGAEIEALLDKRSYLMAAQAIKQKFPYDDYYRFLEETFDTTDIMPAPVHKALFKLNAPLILTTNYDMLLEDAYAIETRHNLLTWTGHNAPDVMNYLHRASSSRRPHLFKVHGSVGDPETIVLTEQDYSHLIHGQEGYRMVLTAIFITRVVLMLGFSGDDPELRLLLEEIREAFNRRGEPDYIVLRRGILNRVERTRWREDLGIEVLEYDATDGDPEITELLELLAQHAPVSSRAF